MKISVLILVMSILIISSHPAANAANPTITQMPEIPDVDTNIYFGHEYGVSGIVESLIKFEIQYPTSEISENIFNSIELGLNYIWNNRIEFNETQISSWSKGPTEQSIYPGKKYGAAGIIPSFLQMDSLVLNSEWLDRAISSYWQLSNEALNGSDFPNWPYSYFEPLDDGISLSDIKYGSIGILSAGMELYSITGNQSYLDHGLLITNWLESIAIDIQIENNNFQVIPWYDIGGISGPVKTGYEWGIAGIAPNIYKLGALLNSEKLKQWGLDLGKFLTSSQNPDGSWNWEFNSEIIFTNFDEGIAGIIFGLNELRNLSGSNIFDESIQNAIKYLFSTYTIQTDFSCFCMDTEGDIMYNNLNRGTLGVLKSLASAHDLLTIDQLNELLSISEWFLTNEIYIIFDGDKELILMNYFVGVDEVIDFSFGEGLAGLLNELLEFESLSVFDTINVNLTQAIIGVANSIIKFQNNLGYWNRQRNIPTLVTSKLELIDSDKQSKLSSSNQSNNPFSVDIFYTGIIAIVLLRNYYNRNNKK